MYDTHFRSGSWDGEIRLWKLDAKLKSFSLVGTLPALGVVNSLQFVSPSKDFFASASWTSRVESEADADDPRPAPPNGKQVKLAAPSVILVGGVGQELRMGRQWISRKGDGYVNGAVVFALHPRT